MKLFQRLILLVRDSRSTLAATILLGFLAGILTIGQAAGLSMIVSDVFILGQGLSDVLSILLLLIIILILKALMTWGSEVCAKIVAVRIKNDLRERIFAKLLDLGPFYSRKQHTGELVNTMMDGVEELDAYFSQYLPQLYLAVIVPLSILIIVFPRDPLSGLVLFLTAPLIPIFMYLIGKTSEVLTKRQWDTLSHLSGHFLDSLKGLATLKELGLSKQHTSTIFEASNQFRDATMKILRITFLSALVLELVATVSTALVAVEVGLRLLYGYISFQQALFLLILAPEFYIPLRMLGMRFHAGMHGTTAAKRIFEILSMPDNIKQGSNQNKQTTLAFSPSSKIEIEFDNLSFFYPGENGPALSNISLKIHSGEHIALIGMSGSGKSTLAALLLRFIDPTRGQILVNQEPLSAYSVNSWRKLVAWVPQHPYLLHDTIFTNLRLARADAADEDINTAARAAHLDELIQSLPQGYETIVGEEGTRFSGGQAQRMALARAFLKDAPILILDEPTSNLDPEEEKLVESSLHHLMRGRTVITIAHRLNTVYQADRIFVLDKGCMVEQGKHHELLAKGGIYSRLVGVTGRIEEYPSIEEDHLEEALPVFREPQRMFTKEGIHQLQNPSLLIRLIGFLDGSWSWVACSVLLGAITIGSNVGLMGTSALLLSEAALHPMLGSLSIAIVGVRFFGITRGVFRYLERLTSHNVTFRLLARLRTWFYQALEPLAPARLMQFKSGDLLARIVADIDSLEIFYVRVISPVLVAILITMGVVFFFSQFNLNLAWLYLLFMLIIGIGVSLFSWTMGRRSGSELINQRAAIHARIVDGILGLADILVFDQGKYYALGIHEQEIAFGKTQQHLAMLSGFSGALTTLLSNLGILSILTISIPLVTMGRINGIYLAVLTLAAAAGFEAVMPLPATAQALSSSMQSAKRLFEIVDIKPMVQDRPLIQLEMTSHSRLIKHELFIKDLTFFYPDQPKPILQELTFNLSPGKRIAVVGPSGAGKTTLANLLMRFWDFSHGNIMIDNRDIHEFVQENVRQFFSYVPQKSFFFNESIRRNLLKARPQANEFEIHNATKCAQIHGFIERLPMKYETEIGELGFRLSGGERQRLAIARAILKDAPIFLLDEPTANLDTLTERKLLEALFSTLGERSLLLITHRLVQLEFMDEILVLDNGRFIERGTHDELLKKRGVYRRLWEVQNRIIFE